MEVKKARTNTISKYIGKRYNKLVVSTFDRVEGHHYFYTCICDCGKQKSIRINHLQQGITKTCGACGYNKEMTRLKNKGNEYHKLPSGEGAFNYLFKRYQIDAIKRKIYFNLTKEEFKHLTKGSCFYCGKNPTSVCKPKYGNGTYVYNGIDRIDNTKEYSMQNCESCCQNCNSKKNSITIDMVIKIYKRLCF